MKQYSKWNQLQWSFNESKTPKKALPIGGKIKSGKFIITGNLVISAGTTSGTALGEGGPINLVKRLRIRSASADGRYRDGLLVDCSGRSLVRYAITQRDGGKFVGELAGSTLGGGNAATYAIYLSIPVSFADSTNRRQKSTSLNTDAYKSLVLEVDLGGATDCFTGTDRTWDTSGLNCQWVDDRENFAGDTYVKVMTDHDHSIQGANKRTLFGELPQADVSVMTQLLLLAQNTAALTLADTIFQRLTFSAANIDFDLFANDIRQSMVDDGWFDAATTATGQYFVDFADGVISGIPIGPGSGFNAVFDLLNPGGAGADTLTAMVHRIVAPLNAKFGA